MFLLSSSNQQQVQFIFFRPLAYIGWKKLFVLISEKHSHYNDFAPGWEGGYSQTLPIRVCAAQRGRDFEAPDLERGIHFRGVF